MVYRLKNRLVQRIRKWLHKPVPEVAESDKSEAFQRIIREYLKEKKKRGIDISQIMSEKSPMSIPEDSSNDFRS